MMFLFRFFRRVQPKEMDDTGPVDAIVRLLRREVGSGAGSTQLPNATDDRFRDSEDMNSR